MFEGEQPCPLCPSDYVQVRSQACCRAPLACASSSCRRLLSQLCLQWAFSGDLATAELNALEFEMSQNKKLKSKVNGHYATPDSSTKERCPAQTQISK